MSSVRVKRVRALPALRRKFAIDFKLEMTGPGVTEAEAAAYVKECMRYASAAFLFQVHHPKGDRDSHKRTGATQCGGALEVSATGQE